jgi:predicted nucleic acid-binding protein
LTELADTSAWTNRHKAPEIRADFARRLDRDEIATCDAVKFELLWSERDAAGIAALRIDLAALPEAAVGRREWSRALDVFELLAARGPMHHRAIGVLDLLIAAAAESSGLTVLHYDRHFEVIARITGQPVRAIAPLGSL